MTLYNRAVQRFQTLFGAEPKITTISTNRYAGYEVEYWPDSGRYYPKHKGEKLVEVPSTGLIEVISPLLSFLVPQWFDTEKEAWTFIDRRINQAQHPVRLTRNEQ